MNNQKTISREELKKWVYKTCHEISSANDLKAICRARGFDNAPKSAGKNALAEFVAARITEPQGVREALATVDAASLWALHSLKCAARPVEIGDIHFFYWGAQHVWDAGDFKKRYERIRDCLVNKGLVLVREIRELFGKRSHYEKLELLIPDAVSEALPTLPLESEPVTQKLVIADWADRAMESIRGNLMAQLKLLDVPRRGIVPVATIHNGVFCLGKREQPSVESVYEVLTRNWLSMDSTKTGPSRSTADISAVDAVEEKDSEAVVLNTMFITPRKYILTSIPPQHAVSLSGIFKAFDRFRCPMKEDIRGEFLAVGVRFGFLVRIGEPDKEMYVSTLGAGTSIEPASFAHAEDAEGCLVMSLERTGLAELLFLGQLSRLELKDQLLRAKPSLIQLGRMRATLDESRDAQALWASSPVFCRAFETVKKREAKLVVHSNLTVLKLGGLDIEAVLMAGYSNRLAPLGNSYFAVCREDLPEILAYVKKKGFTPMMKNLAQGEEA